MNENENVQYVRQFAVSGIVPIWEYSDNNREQKRERIFSVLSFEIKSQQGFCRAYSAIVQAFAHLRPLRTPYR
nr:MAG TPA: hypothetical protein [Inoviridae sp.]